MKALSGILSLVIVICALLVGGCMSVPQSHPKVTLQNFAERNYVNLDRHLEQKVCVLGRLSVDTNGIYFALRPIEQDGIIDVGFSRINTDLSYSDVLKEKIVSGRTYEICGHLIDATPFRGCESNICKWYRLGDAKLRD